MDRHEAPRVAVLLGREPEDRFSVHQGYVRAVFAVGALPVLAVPGPADSDRHVVQLATTCDAVLLTGGHDVAAARYGEADGGKVAGVDQDRDRVEIAVVVAAADRGLRTLGICRGAQVLNVALGGSLHQDLVSDGFDEHSVEAHPHEPAHELRVEPGSLTASLLAGTTKVNSLHHQGVKALGTGLSATAWAPDGLVEAFEGDGLLGLQWHPERLLDLDEVFLAPFRWLTSRERTT